MKPDDLHQLKIRLQQHFSDGLVTVVGCGLSCAEGLPGMDELAGHLCDVVEEMLDADDKRIWSEISALIKKKGLESALLKKPPNRTIEAAIISATANLVVNRERNVIREVFEGSRQLRLTRLLQHMLKPRSGLPIVTTNYDRLAEVAAECAGLGADTLFVGQFAGELNEKESRLSFCRDVTLRKRHAVFTYKERAVVYKPHGSLDWYLRDGRPVRYGGELPGAIRLIITPGHNKFRNGYESPFDVHRARANAAIDSAARFLILGYGFNDDHLETHLMPAIKRGIPTLILTKQLSPASETLALGYKNVIAIDENHESGIVGTRFIVDAVKSFLPNTNFWDVNAFVTEVLEP